MSIPAPNFELIASATRRARLVGLREKCFPILANRLHRHFTDHSVAHSDRIVGLVQLLAGPLRGDRKLSDDEAFVLCCSAYLHDIGMHNENAWQLPRFATRLKGRDWESLPLDDRFDLVRQFHHEISADMVLASLNSGSPLIGLSLEDGDYPGDVACICEAHCIDTDSDRYRRLTAASERPTMRLRLVSALLRLADILDEAHHRALVEQQRTLDLNSVSLVHWWRHYFTREVIVEGDRSRITVWFGFPLSNQEEYSRIVPSLQMPWVEREFARHREVLAENGLSWHLSFQIQQSAFSTLLPMPADVKGLMLQELARQKQKSLEQSRLDVVKLFDELRTHLLAQWVTLDQSRETSSTDDYIRATHQLAIALWRIESRKTAWHRLMGALHFATTNGRSTSPALHVQVATELAWMMADDGLSSDALRELVHARSAADALPDNLPEKVAYFQQFASIALRAGYTDDGIAEAKKAISLLGPGVASDVLEAELREAQFIAGTDPQNIE